MGLEGQAVPQHPRGQVSLRDSKELILPVFKLLSVQVTVQKGVFLSPDRSPKLSCCK